MVDAYRHEDRRRGRESVVALIKSASDGVSNFLTEAAQFRPPDDNRCSPGRVCVAPFGPVPPGQRRDVSARCREPVRQLPAFNVFQRCKVGARVWSEVLTFAYELNILLVEAKSTEQYFEQVARLNPHRRCRGFQRVAPLACQRDRVT